MITEATPLREERPYAAYVGLREVRYSRPGLVAAYNFGASGGPIRGLGESPPVNNTTLVIVSGHTAFDDGGNNLGFISGSDLVRMAVSKTQIVLVADGNAYLFNLNGGNTFDAIPFFVGLPVSDVAYIAGRFVYTLVGNDTFYWSEVEDAANINGLSFASAEVLADPNAGMAVIDDELLFFGGKTVEFWSPDTSAGITDPAFTPNLGSTLKRGCASRDTIQYQDNTAFWLGEDGIVYRVGSVPGRISSSTVEDAISQCADISTCNAFVTTQDGHPLYVLNIPGVASYAYDVSRAGTVEGAYGDSADKGQWGQWISFGFPTFRGQCSVYHGGAWYVGDSASNTVWALTKRVYQDGATPLTRQAAAFIKVEEGRPRCDALVLHAVQGVGDPVDPGSRPIVELSVSDDQGRTFSPWLPSSLGTEGDYANRAYWWGLGTMRAPGRLVRVRCSDPVNVAFSHLELNPAQPSL